MAENDAPEEAPVKKSKLKLIILLVIVVVLAILLSVVGTLWFLGDGLPGMGSEEEGSEEIVEETFMPSSYARLEKALVTTVQAQGRQRYAQVYMSLEATDPQALKAAQLHMPLIRSQLVLLLGSSDFNELQTPEGRQGLAERMLATVNQVLEEEGEPAIKRVLFRNFVVQ
ncbi:flagellar basal body protein FliL [Marinobacter salinus]|uniref:Flagellar protein FliL n=1 Tax=Marinobacter salinus TaxID=1874317 RepID=A0A1D9GHU2_9GAMM|nr:flagellar basal body-associated FliL family protein [Marinobacter salinus]AOY87207.1 flagellar basal body protein FliL [Marinobacter salinus]